MQDDAFKLSIIAQKAGRAILEVKSDFHTGDMQLKRDGSPVTLADLRAHEVIVEALQVMDSNIPIVSEEGVVGDPSSCSIAYLVDPLDGTKEFIRGNGMYTVNIALMERRDGLRWSPILGVVHAPELGATWLGGIHANATRQDRNGIRDISIGRFGKNPVIVGSVSHSSPRDLDFANDVGEHTFEGVGSSIKICRVAEGTADLAPRFGTTSCWDTAAAHAVLNAAGGRILRPDGVELDYDIVDQILNPWFLATSDSRWDNLWISHQV